MRGKTRQPRHCATAFGRGRHGGAAADGRAACLPRRQRRQGCRPTRGGRAGVPRHPEGVRDAIPEIASRCQGTTGCGHGAPREKGVRGMARLASWAAVLGLLGSPVTVYAEDVTITANYPSPRGVYEELRTTDNTFLATAGGNVGIGTTSPGTKLDVSAGIHAENIFFWAPGGA